MNALSNLHKISKNNESADTPTYGSQYPLINFNGECACEKHWYEPSEVTNCSCRATNEICNIYEVTPYVDVTEMRKSTLYISVSN